MVLSLLWSLRGDAAAKHQQNSARPTFAAWQAGFDSVVHAFPFPCPSSPADQCNRDTYPLSLCYIYYASGASWTSLASSGASTIIQNRCEKVVPRMPLAELVGPP